MKRIQDFPRPLFALIIFVLALWFLNRSLHQYHYHEVVSSLKALPPQNIFFALALTVLNYVVLTGYDVLGFRYIRHPLNYGKIALTSFIGYSFSQSLGLPVLTGASVRFRLYSFWGLSTAEIAQIVTFTTLTFWLGVLTIGGAALLMRPAALGEWSFAVPIRVLAIFFLFIAAAYLLWCAYGSKTFRIKDRDFAPPSFALAAAQLIASTADWALAGTILYILVPGALRFSYPGFIEIFLTSQILGLISNVPGGIGVFESAMVLFASTRIQPTTMLASLVAYRAIYYLLPLLISAILFAALELFRSRDQVKRITRFLGSWTREVAPTIFALTAFLSGALLLFSGATPSVHNRVAGLRILVPLPLLEISHFLGSMAGVGLLLLARGLQRRVDAAYLLTCVLLGTGIFASVFKGFDYEEAIVLTIILALLLPCRSYFYRKASLIGERFSAEWIVAIALVLISSVWLTLFSYKHVSYSHELWWQFAFSGDAPRSLRAAVGAFGLAFTVAIIQLLRPAVPEFESPEPDELNRAYQIIQHNGNTSAYLALLADKTFLFSDSGNSFLMYGVEGRSWIALGNPVGRMDEKSKLVWQFHELCDRHDGWTVFYDVDLAHLPLYLDLGLTLLKLGEEARVRLESFHVNGADRKTFRHLLNKFEKEGFSFEIIPSEQVPSMMEEFREISDRWLDQKNTREKGFSIGFFSPDYLKLFPAGIVRRNGTILGFVNIWTGANREELSVDLMRYRPEAPNGVMDYMFLSLMFWGKENGYQWFNLGMAPLSGLEDRTLAPLWNRVGALIYRQGEHFYNFQGLRHYKEKFDPCWEPKYLASPGGLALPRILTNLAALIGRGLKGVITK